MLPCLISHMVREGGEPLQQRLSIFAELAQKRTDWRRARICSGANTMRSTFAT